MQDCYLPIEGMAREPWELSMDHDMCPDARTGADIILPHGAMQEATMAFPSQILTQTWGRVFRPVDQYDEEQCER